MRAFDHSRNWSGEKSQLQRLLQFEFRRATMNIRCILWTSLDRLVTRGSANDDALISTDRAVSIVASGSSSDDVTLDNPSPVLLGTTAEGSRAVHCVFHEIMLDQLYNTVRLTAAYIG